MQFFCGKCIEIKRYPYGKRGMAKVHEINGNRNNWAGIMKFVDLPIKWDIFQIKRGI